MHEGVEVYLTPALYGGEQSVSQSVCINPGKEIQYIWNSSWLGPKVSLKTAEKERITYMFQ
jgi:hypothetical protein